MRHPCRRMSWHAKHSNLTRSGGDTCHGRSSSATTPRLPDTGRFDSFLPPIRPDAVRHLHQRDEGEGVPWERWILHNFSKMRVHARLSFIATTNLTSFVTLIRCLIGRSKPLVRFEEFGQAVFHKKVKIQRSAGTSFLVQPFG